MTQELVQQENMVGQTAPPKSKMMISLRWLMIVGFGGLVFLSIAGVLTMSVLSNFRNTFSLLNQSSLRLVASMENAIEEEVHQMEFALEGLSRMHNEKDLGLADDPRWRRTLTTLLHSIQILESVFVIDKNGNEVGFMRLPVGDIKPMPRQFTQGVDFKPNGNSADPLQEPKWIEPDRRGTVLFHRVRIFLVENGEPVAQVIASTGGRSLNRIATRLGRENNAVAFILDDQEQLIAYSKDPSLMKNKSGIALSDVPDKALNLFSNAEEVGNDVMVDVQPESLSIKRSDEEHTTGFVADESGEGEAFVFITKKIRLFSPEPYKVGAYFKEADVNTELVRATRSAVIGFAALVLAVLIAVFMSNRLTRPMLKIAAATDHFSRLELNEYETLPRSRIREIDEQASSINSMHTALTEFRKYVPHELVRRILSSGAIVTKPVERELTIMFTDLVNFTSISENMSVSETTRLLNAHFEIVSRSISSAGGTVDKYLGDGVIAFWGAPEIDDDQAQNAIHAALEIQKEHTAAQAQRAADGLEKLRLRIGLHTGVAIVGNIGGNDRTNYTVTGHTVNVANRIEQLAKTVLPDTDVAILVSEECYIAAGKPDNFHAAGTHTLRGSSTPVSVYAPELS